MSTTIHTIILVGAVLLIIDFAMFIAAVSFVVARLRKVHDHEETHCGQIGELQAIVAQLANHLRSMSAEPLPSPVQQYVDDAAAHHYLDERGSFDG